METVICRPPSSSSFLLPIRSTSISPTKVLDRGRCNPKAEQLSVQVRWTESCSWAVAQGLWFALQKQGYLGAQRQAAPHIVCYLPTFTAPTTCKPQHERPSCQPCGKDSPKPSGESQTLHVHHWLWGS